MTYEISFSFELNKATEAVKINCNSSSVFLCYVGKWKIKTNKEAPGKKLRYNCKMPRLRLYP